MNAVRVAALHVHPIASCTGVALQEMRFDDQGPLDDRRWMRVGDRLQVDPPPG
jgi:uncharacterized protein YcbX